LSDSNILESILCAAREDLDFFSNSGKETRERWVISKFLKIINYSFEEAEISSLEQASKVDVEFRDARFQIKEITNPKLLRGKKTKSTYNAIKVAEKLEDIELPSIAEDIPKLAKMYDLVFVETKKLSESETYKASKHHLDLIFYITRTRASLIRVEDINIKDFSSLGWRSVTCLNGKQAAVLYTNSDAPYFLKECSGMVVDIGN
jgi:hypothetical protein